MAEFKPEELVEKVLNTVKADPSMLSKITGGDLGALQKVLGNIKLDASQAEKVMALIRKSPIAKDLLGADGKLDASDVARLAKEVSKDPSGLLNAAAGLLGKKK